MNKEKSFEEIKFIIVRSGISAKKKFEMINYLYCLMYYIEDFKTEIVVGLIGLIDKYSKDDNHLLFLKECLENINYNKQRNEIEFCLVMIDSKLLGKTGEDDVNRMLFERGCIKGSSYYYTDSELFNIFEE